MRYCLVLSIFVIVLQIVSSQKPSEDDSKHALNSVEDKEIKYYSDDDDKGNPDNYEIIERPCETFDIFCIRKFFAERSNCKISSGPVKEPHYVAENNLYFVNNNLTVTKTNSMVTGLNGRIVEFYVNKATSNLLLAIYFEGVKFDSNPVYFRFNRRGQEPIERTAFALFDYAKLTVTVIIPNADHLALEDAEVNAQYANPLLPFLLGPEVLESTDPTVIAVVASILADVPTTTIELLPTVAPLIGSIFIQKNICDFGIHPYN